MRPTRTKFNITATVKKDGTMELNGSPAANAKENDALSNSPEPVGGIFIRLDKDAPAQQLFEAGVTKQYYVDFSSAEL